MQKFSYHTHTKTSDGDNTAEEMINRAERLGWEEIGLSDHLIVHKNIKQSSSWDRWKKMPNNHVFCSDFKMATDRFCRHVENVRKIAAGRNIKVRIGAETDFFVYDGWKEEFEEFIRQTELDYYISGNHFLQPDNGNSILDMKDTDYCSLEEANHLIRFHFKVMQEAIKSGHFSFLAHLDYVRKNKLCGVDDCKEDKLEVIKCLQQNHMATELSTKGLRKTNDYYPAKWMLKELIERRIPLVISDDAHRIEEVGYRFDEAEKYLESNNCQYRWKYKKSDYAK